MPGSRSERFKKIRYVFLDRDGVLNRKAAEGEYVFRRSDFELLPGVEEALARLKSTGRKLIMVTNQRCVALGLCSEDDVWTLHQ
jgi:D-glycero-D-manno-heptose 1,7-bisphosphate phosphatase